MSPREPESVVMDMWEVPPGPQQELIDALQRRIPSDLLLR